MGQQRRKFSPQFKAEAVQFVIESGRPVAWACRSRIPAFVTLSRTTRYLCCSGITVELPTGT